MWNKKTSLSRVFLRRKRKVFVSEKHCKRKRLATLSNTRRAGRRQEHKKKTGFFLFAINKGCSDASFTLPISESFFHQQNWNSFFSVFFFFFPLSFEVYMKLSILFFKFQNTRFLPSCHNILLSSIHNFGSDFKKWNKSLENNIFVCFLIWKTFVLFLSELFGNKKSLRLKDCSKSRGKKWRKLLLVVKVDKKYVCLFVGQRLLMYEVSGNNKIRSINKFEPTMFRAILMIFKKQLIKRIC